jgi:hypothetical protein
LSSRKDITTAKPTEVVKDLFLGANQQRSVRGVGTVRQSSFSQYLLHPDEVEDLAVILTDPAETAADLETVL